MRASDYVKRRKRKLPADEVKVAAAATTTALPKKIIKSLPKVEKKKTVVVVAAAATTATITPVKKKKEEKENLETFYPNIEEWVAGWVFNQNLFKHQKFLTEYTNKLVNEVLREMNEDEESISSISDDDLYIIINDAQWTVFPWPRIFKLEDISKDYWINHPTGKFDEEHSDYREDTITSFRADLSLK